MKNTLNEILSMMSKIDPSYVSEEGGNGNDIGSLFSDGSLNAPYNDSVHFIKAVRFIDYALSDDTSLNNCVNLLKDNAIVKKLLIQGKFRNKKTFEEGTLGNALLTVCMILNPSLPKYWDVETGELNEGKNIVETPGYDFSKILTNLSNSETVRLFDVIKTEILFSVKESMENGTFDSDKTKKDFCQKIYQNFGVAYGNGVADKEVDYIYSFINDTVKQATNNDSKLFDIDKLIKNKITDLFLFINKNLKETGKTLPKSSEKASLASIRNTKTISKYDGIKRNDGEKTDYLFTNPYSTQKITKQWTTGPTPGVLREYFSDGKYARLRGYFYYSFYKSKNGYSNELRKYLFGQNGCLSDDVKNADYNVIMWDDPLYGDYKNDPNYVNEALNDIYERLQYVFQKESIEKVSLNLRNVINDINPIQNKNANTVYETLQMILSLVKNGNIDEMGLLGQTFTTDNIFSKLCSVFSYILNHEKFGNYGDVPAEYILKNTPLEVIFGDSEEMMSKLPESGLFKYDEVGNGSNFGILDFFQQAYSFAQKNNEFEGGNKVEKSILNFCNDIMTNYITKTVVTESTEENSILSIIDSLVANYPDLLWKRGLNEGGKYGRDEEIENAIGGMSFDVYNKTITTLIEYQGPHHFPFGNEHGVSQKVACEEITEARRRNAYINRRNEFIEFIISYAKNKNNDIRNEIVLEGVDFINIRKAFVQNIINEFDGKNIDKYGIEINREEETIDLPSKIVKITRSGQINTPQRWFNETEVWIRELKDNAKIQQICKQSSNDKSTFLGKSLFIHLYDKSVISESDFEYNDSEDIRIVKDELRNVVRKFTYSLRYGKLSSKYALYKDKNNNIIIMRLEDNWIKNYKENGSFKTIFWSNNKGSENKKLEEILVNRCEEKIGRAKAKTIYNDLRKTLHIKPNDVGQIGEDKSFFKRIVEEVIRTKNGEN